MKENPLNVQVGGTHYKNVQYQPVEFSCHNHLNFIQGTMIKYVVRYRNKNGKEDLEKVLHYADLGQSLQPKSYFVEKGTMVDVGRFRKMNNLSEQILDVCTAICFQNWDRVKILVNRIIEQEYGE